MKMRALLPALLALTVTPVVLAEAPAAYKTCSVCHGADAGGNAALGAPAIAGQDGAYLLRQLNAFRSGVRGPESPEAQTMAAAVAALDAAQAQTLANWLAAQPSRPVAAQTTTADLRVGENQYNANCGACHGAAGKGNALLGAPRLAGMDIGYMTRQYVAFQSGKRGTDGKFGKQMAMMAKAVGDAGLEDTLAWLQAQGAE